MKNSVLRIFELMKEGELKFILQGISKRIQSTNESFGLKRDLNIDFQNPEALIELVIRLYKAEDRNHFTMDLQNDGLIEKNIPTCYVATTTEDIPCFRQWLIGPQQNKKIQEFWGKTFPVLKNDEALLESAITPPNFRGKRIMPTAMARIAEKGKDLGVKYVITFVGTDNIASLKGCMRAGFSPYTLRTEKWFLFKRSINFQEVPKDYMDVYSNNVNGSKAKV